MTYKIFAADSGRYFWDKYFAADFVNYLTAAGHRCTVGPKSSFDLRGCELRPLNRTIVIQNMGTGQFALLNHYDAYECDYLDRFADRPDCVAILKCQYRYYNGIHPKVVPYTYKERDHINYRSIQPFLVDTPKTDTGLNFRGNTTARDKRRERAKVVDLLRPHLSINPDERIPPDAFYAELAAMRLALSLPGNGICCHREIECFGIKTPVIMPRLLNRYYEDLLPDFHYVSVDADWERDPPELKARRIIDRFNTVINDTEFLHTIAENAYQWYMRNIAYPGNIELATTILKLRGMDF